MTDNTSKVSPYPRSHILAASGAAALLSLALLVFPTREVEAKKTFLGLDLNQSSEQQPLDDGNLRTGLAPPGDKPPSPFAETGNLDNQNSVESATKEEDQNSTPHNPLEHSIAVVSGDTLSTVFARVGLGSSALHEALNSSKDAKRFSQLRVGQTLNFTLNEQGELIKLSSQLSDLESIQLTRNEQGLSFKREVIKPEVRQQYAHGVINSSLFLAAKNAGLSHNLTMDLANVFGYDIDFAQDIRAGDSFEVIYEEKVVNDKRVGSGNILAARFTNRGKTYSAVRYANRQGAVSYYNADGMSMRKAFIRTPVDFARISSRFSNGRRHPVLNKIRAHKGVDYAAPRGTPIKAAGDGRVQLAGRKGGYGNTVIIQHGNAYKTLYAHMNGFAKGIRNGVNVKQGQIIGYIGTTGLSTGPHLHYEFQVNGVHVDPLSQKLPMADPIPNAEKPRFLAQSRPLMARMDQEKTTWLAANQAN